MVGRAVLTVAMLTTLGLAGCASDESPATANEALATGQGVIEGLLVDDRFRPIDLEDDPATEFQAEGFILIQETGEQVATNENGEFRSSPLGAGTYTVRAKVSGHETAPRTVEVASGEITEATLIARRVVSTEDLVFTHEFAVFIPCTFAAIVTPMQVDCTGDQSGDTSRFAYRLNITEYPDATFLVTEVLLNKEAGETQDGTFMMQIEGPSQDGATSHNYVSKFIEEGKYDKTLLQKGVEHERHDDPLLNYGTWEGGDWIGWRFWGQGLLRKDLNEAGVPVSYGVGVQLGIKAKVLTSLYFTEDRSVPETYCGLCGDGA